MKRTRLKSKELNRTLGLELSKKDQVELVEDEFKIYCINGIPSFFHYKDKVVPTLKYLQNHDALPKITVDMGAIKFVINGADIMRPGITKIDEGIDKDEFIVIVDETHGKPLAVGIALLNSGDMKKSASGKVIKNIHFVADELWKMEL